MVHSKVAVATDDGATISRHFGYAGSYLVYHIEDGIVKERETRPKASRQGLETERHPQDQEEKGLHESMLSNVTDCQAILARGMGWGIYQEMKRRGIRPFVTDVESADEAIKAYLAGTLVDHYERLH